MNMNDNKLSILAEHYKNTFDFQKENLLRRDKLFFLILCLLVLKLFIIYTPNDAFILISQFIQEKLSLKSEINLLFVQSVIWFSLLALVIKYFQSVIFIERQYNYIHKIEALLSQEYENKTFTREGISYLKDYPKFLNWASFLYTILFPIILLVISTLKIFSEFNIFGFKELLIWFNLFIYIILLIAIVLCQFELHLKNKNT